jgi:hypothetical protein
MDGVLTPQERELYREALIAFNNSGIDYMLGGALGVYYYTDWWRSTHDLDIYVAPNDVDRARVILTEIGFHDIGEQAQGDREWIYHARKDGLIVDIIWRFANLIDFVAPDWITRAPRGRFLEVDTRFLPLEELIWVKIFVINRHRCDWPDIMRIIRNQCLNLDWYRLIDLIGEHWLLLAGMIDVLDWQYPDGMGCIPDDVRATLLERRLHYRPDKVGINREALLDPWLYQRGDTKCNLAL